MNDENLKYEVEKENVIGSVDVQEHEEPTIKKETSNISKDFNVKDEDDEEVEQPNETYSYVEETGEIVGNTHNDQEENNDDNEEKQTEEIVDPEGFMAFISGNQ